MIRAIMLTERQLRLRLGANLRAYRNTASLSAQKAAERARMNVRHWQKIEAGSINVTLQTLARLGAALGVDAAILLAAPLPPPDATAPGASSKPKPPQ